LQANQVQINLDEVIFNKYFNASMIVGVMTAHLSLLGVTSLKGKRSIVKSLIGRLKSRFNISVSEVDHQDNKSVAILGIAIVSNNVGFIDKQFDSILDFMRNDGRFYLGQVEREIF
jgi:uncharacterized protein YlxP (DUF503 family)